MNWEHWREQESFIALNRSWAWITRLRWLHCSASQTYLDSPSLVWSSLDLQFLSSLQCCSRFTEGLGILPECHGNPRGRTGTQEHSKVLEIVHLSWGTASICQLQINTSLNILSYEGNQSTLLHKSQVIDFKCLTFFILLSMHKLSVAFRLFGTDPSISCNLLSYSGLQGIQSLWAHGREQPRMGLKPITGHTWHIHSQLREIW